MTPTAARRILPVPLQACANPLSVPKADTLAAPMRKFLLFVSNFILSFLLLCLGVHLFWREVTSIILPENALDRKRAFVCAPQ